MSGERILWVSKKRFAQMQELSAECSKNFPFNEAKWIAGLKKLLGYSTVTRMLCSPFAPYSVKISHEEFGDEIFGIRETPTINFDEEEGFLKASADKRD